MGRGKTRRAWLIVLGLALFVAGHDSAVPTSRAFGANAALAMIRSYQHHVSPHLAGVIQCRFTPTCSHYGAESIRKHGLVAGGARTAWRIARCGPWTKLGTVDLP